MIITTTPILDGWKIKRYMQPISANVIIGTNIISEMGASWTDFFGGRSGSYERKMQSIYDQVIDSLRKKAKTVGANCIVGLSIDIDEISGKGTQMFMITAIGTPVKAESMDANESTAIVSNKPIYNGHLVDSKIKALEILAVFEKSKNIRSFYDETLDFISESSLHELYPIVLAGINEDGFDAGFTIDKQKKLLLYFSNVDAGFAVEMLYKELENADLTDLGRSNIVNIILNNNLLDNECIKVLLNSENLSAKKSGLALLSAGRNSYSEHDVGYMKDFIAIIPNKFAETGQRTTHRSMLSSAAKDVWICQCGERNNINTRYCVSCFTDIYGFNQKEQKPLEVVELLATKVKVMEDLSRQVL